MRISKLSERSGLPVGTVKFYLRTGLLHPGVATSATQAVYDESHLARLRLIRAMLEVGRLSLAEIQRILDSVDLPAGDPEARARLVEAAVAGTAVSDDRARPTEAAADGITTEVTQVLRDIGWQFAADSPHLPGLGRAVRAARSVGLTVDRARLTVCAEAAAHVALSDHSALDAAPEDERPTQLAASLVLMDPILAALRHLAGEHQAALDKGNVPGPRLPVSNA